MLILAALKIILLAVSITAALVWVVLAIRKARTNTRKWNKAEPGIIREIETVTGQQVECKLKLNASRTADFTANRVFWIWLACTRDHLVLVHPDQVGDTGSAHLFVTSRKDASVRLLEKRFAELEIQAPDAGEAVKLVVLVRPCDYEMLTNYLNG
ncbi:hypothetical protein [Alistipes sp.]|uniref:hypothetical protein n=1 Tax=Alistipes sp. TaxID=1872444 RepID=UPI003AEFA25C